MPLAYPPLRTQNFSMWLETSTQVFRSPLDGSDQTAENTGARWKARIGYEVLQLADRITLEAFFDQLRGQSGRFYLKHAVNGVTPRGTIAGQVPLVNGAGQTGNTLAIDGVTPTTTTFLKGDMFALPNNELKRLTADSTANGAGEMTVTFEPPIRVSPADNAAITIASPSCIAKLTEDAIPPRYTPAGGGPIAGYDFECEEVF